MRCPRRNTLTLWRLQQDYLAFSGELPLGWMCDIAAIAPIKTIKM
jgi:hypothetical protein